LHEFSINEAKSWFSQNIQKVEPANNRIVGIENFKPDWEKAINTEDDNYLIVECPIKFNQTPGFLVSNTVSNEKSNKLINGKTILLILKNKKSKYVQSSFMHIFSDKAVTEFSTYSRKGKDFCGVVFFTRLNGQFINGWIYKDGKIIKKSNNKVNQIASREGPEEECSNVTTNWYTRTCFYYLDGTSDCTPWIYTGSTTQNYCLGSGTGGYPTDVYNESSESSLNVDCKSFAYTKTSTANWQEAGLNNIRLKWVWAAGSNSGMVKELYINHIVFGLPTKYADGTTLTPGKAATITAQLIDYVKGEVYYEFRNSPYYPSNEEIITFFRNAMHAAMIIKGGTAGMTGTGSPAIIFKNEERSNWTNPYDCN